MRRRHCVVNTTTKDAECLRLLLSQTLLLQLLMTLMDSAIAWLTTWRHDFAPHVHLATTAYSVERRQQQLIVTTSEDHRRRRTATERCRQLDGASSGRDRKDGRTPMTIGWHCCYWRHSRLAAMTTRQLVTSDVRHVTSLTSRAPARAGEVSREMHAASQLQWNAYVRPKLNQKVLSSLYMSTE